MSPRVAGAALALLAAVLLVASIAGIPAGWWAGHPLRNGEPMHKKDVDVTMLTAVGCNTGGDGSCEPLPMTSGFDAVRYVELGTSGLLALAALMLAGATLTASERRKQLAKVVIAGAIACAVIAIVLIVMPKMKIKTISLPIGPGLFVFFGGIACAILGSILAMRPTPKLELQPPRQSFAPMLAPPPTAQPVDVLALLHDDPRAHPVDPTRPPPSPGGQLAGPAGPLAPPGYGAMPPTYPTMPTPAPFRAPEPAMPFPAPPAPFGAHPGGPPLATPPPPDARARSASVAPPPSPPDRSKASGSMPAALGDRSKASSSMPALPGDRFKASGTAPAMPGPDRSKGSGNVPALPDVRPTSPSGSPPSAEARTKAASIPPPARAKAGSVAPIDRPKSPIPSTVAGLMPPARPKGPTGVPPSRGLDASVPPPAGPRPTTVAAVVPPPVHVAPLLPAMLPIRAATDPTDHLETMDRDAMTIARDGAPAVSIGRPATDASIGDSTDANVVLPPGSDAAEDAADNAETTGIEKFSATDLAARDSTSDIQTSAQRQLTPSELVRTVARESQSEIETIAREKISASELAIGDSTSPVVVPIEPTRSAIEELGEAPTQLAASVPAKIPVSTAPESLPPPNKDEVASSGPTPACPQCEAPMAWVEEHLRFYCKSCRMYF